MKFTAGLVAERDSLCSGDNKIMMGDKVTPLFPDPKEPPFWHFASPKVLTLITLHEHVQCQIDKPGRNQDSENGRYMGTDLGLAIKTSDGKIHQFTSLCQKHELPMVAEGKYPCARHILNLETPNETTWEIGGQPWTMGQLRQLLFFVTGQSTMGIMDGLGLGLSSSMMCSEKVATGGSSINSRWTATRESSSDIRMSYHVWFTGTKNRDANYPYDFGGELEAGFTIPSSFDPTCSNATMDVQVELKFQICHKGEC